MTANIQLFFKPLSLYIAASNTCGAYHLHKFLHPFIPSRPMNQHEEILW